MGDVQSVADRERAAPMQGSLGRTDLARGRTDQTTASDDSRWDTAKELAALPSRCIPRAQRGALTAILPALLIPERLPGRFSWSKCQGNGTEDDHMRS